MPDIHGSLEGIRNSLINELKTLYDYPIGSDEYLPVGLADLLGRYSAALNREISLYITRDGEIIDITVGDTSSVSLSSFRLSRSERRLSKVRCIHTHPRGTAELSDVDITAQRSLLLDSMCALGVDNEGRITGVQASFLQERVDGVPRPLITPIFSMKRIPQQDWMDEILLSEQLVQTGDDVPQDSKQERALLVGIDSEASLDELAALAESAGAVVVGRSLQRKSKPDTFSFVGSGKAEELALDAQALEADVVIMDDDLTGAQLRNLEDIIHVKTIDRTALILDIFAQRARTSEGRLQVELAQLRYQSTRLIGQGLSLSRLAGGIGTRGPGESKLEIDRRRIREKITRLRHELNELEAQRAIRRRARERNAVPIVALVGYTNVGKSTLLNRLSGSDVYVENRLFATLDATSRLISLPDGGEFLLVDTVGFIRKLPTELIEAFHSTLEEAALADVLLLVSDATAPDLLAQREVVCNVLDQLGATKQPRIDILNKCDDSVPEEYPQIPRAVRVSAKTGEGMDDLLTAIAAELRNREQKVTLLVPFNQYSVIGELRSSGRIVSEEHNESGTLITIMLEPAAYGRLSSRYPQLFTTGGGDA